MCGILAIYRKYEECHMSEIAKAHAILSNRGPDCGKIITEPSIMGFRRLAIMDTSDKGVQPFEKGRVKVLCNGEIYNHKELEKRWDLNCVSGSDCECIIHLYKKLGWYKTFTQLRGDFAVIIIDGPDMYFGRDNIGVRPLYWGRTKSGNFALASYARALTEYCNEVGQVPPGTGHYKSSSDKFIFNRNSTLLDITYIPGVREEIRKTLTNAVKSRLMSDRPVGCLLSGGLDSSLIVSILCKLIGAENVRTYSIGMEGSEDLKHARTLANTLGTHHNEIKFTPEEGFQAISDVIRDLESYDITTIRASVGMWLLAKWISKNTTDIVLLSGEGADELFCGYLYFHSAPNTHELKSESIRLVKNLYLYDVLRADRCISSHGLELRVPFLDSEMVKLCMSISGDLLKPRDGVTKHILREAFVDNYLSKEILWRRKEAFSDGVSGKDKKWFEHIKGFVEDIITDDIFDHNKYPSKEAQYYRLIYNNHFPNYQPTYEYWLPKWSDHKGDPSACVLDIYKNSCKIKRLT
ncbi:asparagine synthase (glutamine-hydrolyzing) [Pirellulaceae bacterium]|jgi:asparagine synthase (glutamine-hydrolysing)|nr:asparagine synthase (glutamine-hydrolyzing) [Pirellulaceae bacterium]